MADVVTNLILYPIEERLLGPGHQIIYHNSKTALYSTFKLGVFSFIYQTHFGRIVAKSIHQGREGGLLQLCLKWRRLEKLNKQNFFCFKTMQMHGGYKLVAGKLFLGIRSGFSGVFLDFRR